MEAFLAGVAAADPTVLVRKAVRQGLLDDWLFGGGAVDQAHGAGPGGPQVRAGGSRERPWPIRVLALGKAAPRMVWGLVEASVPFSGLGVAPKGVPAPGIDTFGWLPGDHPVPGAASFAAGARLLEWADEFPEGEPLLVLLSGGASACVEAPAPGLSGAGLQGRWRDLLRSGLPVEAMNRERAALSALKGGRLGRRLLARTHRIRVWLLADTDPAQAAAAVGSGPLFQQEAPDAIPHRVLADSSALVVAAGLRLASLGYEVYRHAERIQGPAEKEVDRFLDAFAGLPRDRPAALVGGGECTVALPAQAPPGGRCQHAALLAARRLREAGLGAAFLACASDGVDGGTDAAGAVATAADAGPEAEDALARFDAHRFLDRRGRLVHTGPTGTNVNDLWVALG